MSFESFVAADDACKAQLSRLAGIIRSGRDPSTSDLAEARLSIQSYWSEAVTEGRLQQDDMMRLRLGALSLIPRLKTANYDRRKVYEAFRQLCQKTSPKHVSLVDTFFKFGVGRNGREFAAMLLCDLFVTVQLGLPDNSHLYSRRGSGFAIR
jgi:hypothetical protein